MKTVHYFLINFILAVIWVILNRQPNISDFIIGFAIGFIILWAFQHILKSFSYIRRCRGIIQFVFIFMWIFIKANLNVARIILFVPQSRLRSGFVDYDVSHLRYFEALLISHFITLTPGTISIKLDKNKLQLHVLDLQDANQTIKEIDLHLKLPILKFTR